MKTSALKPLRIGSPSMLLMATMVILVGSTFLPVSAATPPTPRSKAAVEAILQKAPAPSGKALRPLHVLLVAGPKDHGPGEHDYPKWQKDWAPLLAKAPMVKVSTAFPWPEPGQWEGVDLVVFYLKTKWDSAQVEQIRKHQAKGGGVATIHWAIGCDQEWHNHAQCFGLSYKAASYRHGPVQLKLSMPDHPITSGLPKIMDFIDEPYWPFIGDASKVQVLATSDEFIYRGDDRAKNPGDATVQTIPVFWAYQPPATSARVFVSIFGHYSWTFDDPYFRLLMLRGMAWAAKESPHRFDSLAIDGVQLNP